MSSKLVVELPEGLVEQIERVVREGGVYRDATEFVRHAMIRRVDEILGFPEHRTSPEDEAQIAIVKYLDEVPGPHDPIEISISLGLDVREANEALRSLFLKDVIELALRAEWVISRKEGRA